MKWHTLIVLTLGLFVSLPVGVLLPLTVSAEDDDAPRLYDYITDDVGTLLYSGYYYDTYDICEFIHTNTSSEILIYIINSTGDKPIDLYAFDVFDANEIGDEEKDNGVLMLFAIGDDAYFIVVGSGIEYVLTDGRVGGFARDYFVPWAEAGDPGYGIYALTVVIAFEIADKYEQASPHSYPVEGIPLEWPELILAVTVFMAVVIITRGKIFLWIGGSLRKWGGGGTSGGGAGGRY